jgi:hypothetical protein
MNDSFIKDIVYDLIASKLKIKELEDRIAKLEIENKDLTDANISLKEDANKWKTQAVSYIDDYRKLYKYSDESVDNTDKESVDKEEIVENVVEGVENTVEDTKKTRKEYMKEFMRNKRKKEKEELKNIIINKK